jgi:hypothetical protein
MVCVSTFFLNRAAIDFKMKYCKGGEFNEKKCVRILSDVSAETYGTTKNPQKWPLAVMSDECIPASDRKNTDGAKH